MLELEKLRNAPHNRRNPLTGEWVLVSPHRLERPWQGKVEQTQTGKRPAYDPQCYLCPGNVRAGGKHNPPYTGTFVFQNDFSALLEHSEAAQLESDELLKAQSVRGLCRVVCFSPRHDLTIAEMEREQLLGVVDVWSEQFLELGAKDFVRYVQIFENKGQIMGCSNPHPHGQIWATEALPVEPAKEDAAQRDYRERRGGKCLLCEYGRLEQAAAERIVCQNDAWMALVPFWAKWPYEAMLLPKRHAGHLGELDAGEREGLADILKRMTTRYDNLFEVSFPYTMGFHQAPTDGAHHAHWHLHGHFYPPLLRSATIQKFMVGFEMLATPQRDLTPETAAERLKALSEEHYTLLAQEADAAAEAPPR